MALIWERRVGDNSYQVRNHGASLRLYSNGVFHSQWNPRDPLRGSLWELLLLPAFFAPPTRIRSVLVLGVGGGALIRLLQRYVRPQRIVGVDLDPTHLHIARRYFGVRGAELICDDARNYVSSCIEKRDQCSFDLVIDDLFGHADGIPERSVVADAPWCTSLLQLAGEGGIVVGNFGSRDEVLQSGWRTRAIRDRLRGGWTAEMAAYENCVLAVSRQPLRRSVLVELAPREINPENPSRRLDCRLRELR